MPTELMQKQENGIVSFMTPTDFESATKIADVLSKSGLVPKDYQNRPADIIVAMAHGAELGLQPVAALQSIAVINGRPSLWGDAVLGLVKTKADYEYIRETFDTVTMSANCTIKRRGEPEYTSTFSQKDAEVAGLWKTNTWAKYPQRMLQMRARGFAIRSVFPHHLKGIALAEEAQDYTPEAPKYDTNAIKVVDAEKIEPMHDSETESVLVPSVKYATAEQVDKIRQYGHEQLKHKSDDETVAYIIKKTGMTLASLYDLDEPTAAILLQKMYPSEK